MILTQQLLDQLERRWRENDALILHHLQPGLSDEQIDQLTAPLGLRLPEEARRWWRWHDGAPMDAPPGSRDIGAGPNYIPLSYAVEQTEFLRSLDPVVWSDTWLVMTDESDPLVMDCGGAFDEPVCVRTTALQDPEPPPADHATTSIGELISLWIEAFDNGAYTYDKDVGRWERHPERLTPRMSGRGLV